MRIFAKKLENVFFFEEEWYSATKKNLIDFRYFPFFKQASETFKNTQPDPLNNLLKKLIEW